MAVTLGLALMALAGYWWDWHRQEPVIVSTVLVVVVGLLSVEWLTRKLLRLA